MTCNCRLSCRRIGIRRRIFQDTIGRRRTRTRQGICRGTRSRRRIWIHRRSCDRNPVSE